MFAATGAIAAKRRAGGTATVTVKLWGSSGGGGDGAGGSTTGGKGGILAFTLELPVGHVLQLHVPSKGLGANGSYGGRPGGTGWGNGGVGGTQDSNQEAGGGGASAAVEDDAATLLAVASGGGGASSHASHIPANGYDGAPRSSGASLTPANTGGNPSKHGAPGTSGSGSGQAGGGGGGADNTNTGGGNTLCHAGQALLNTSVHSVARDTTSEASMTPMAGGFATGNGLDGKIEITDGAGTTVYLTPGTPTHVVS